MVADGPTVREFESEFADYTGADDAVGVANGTAALHAALEALEIGEGDRVVTTPLSFVASANAIRLAGARPVFADVDPLTYNLDPEATERAAPGKFPAAVAGPYIGRVAVGTGPGEPPTPVRWRGRASPTAGGFAEAAGLMTSLHHLGYDHAAAAPRMHVVGLAGGYATTLTTGIWPSWDILPAEERERAGTPLPETQRLDWGADIAVG
jgi:hypothetical protein